MVDDNDDALVCRCCEVTRREVIEAIRQGARSVNEVKRMTRAGMGICQGRTCSRLVAQIVQQETGLPIEAIGLATSRPPVRPVGAQVIAASRASDDTGAS